MSVAHLVSDIPSEFVFFDHLGTFGWVDEGTVALTSRDGKRRLTARASRDGQVD